MATVMDLAVEFDLHPDAVVRWFRANGCGQPRGRLSVKLERAFREAHEQRSFESAMLAPRRVRGQRRAQVLGSDAARGVAGPAEASGGSVGPMGLAEHYKEKHAEALAALRRAKAECERLRIVADEAEARRAQADARTIDFEADIERLLRADAEAEPWGVALGDALARRGLLGPAAREAVFALLADERAGEALLTGLRFEDEALLAPLMAVCADPVCRDVAELDGRLAVDGPCAVCQGSASRRWWQRMARACVQACRTRLLIVGGSDPSHARVSLLAAETPGLAVSIVHGTSNQSRQRAREKVQSADLVIVWSSTILDHRVSDVYRAAVERAPDVMRISVREGGRGIVSLAQAVLQALAGDSGAA